MLQIQTNPKIKITLQNPSIDHVDHTLHTNRTYCTNTYSVVHLNQRLAPTPQFLGMVEQVYSTQNGRREDEAGQGEGKGSNQTPVIYRSCFL